jgi:hypothetical protein
MEVLTDDHFAAYGKMIDAFAKAEMLWDVLFASALDLEHRQAAHLLRVIPIDNKRMMVAGLVDRGA